MEISTAWSAVNRSAKLRWAVPVTVAAVVAGAAVSVPLLADADAEPAERTPGEILAALVESGDVPFAGTIVHSADLGIPGLESLTGESKSPLSLLGGATTARAWYVDEQTFRVAVYGELSESDVIRDGSDAWYWNSDEDRAVHTTLPGLPESAQESGESRASMPPLPPQAMADLAINLLEPTTEVSVDGTATVAGRAAHELVLSPRDERSLIGSVRLAVDADHGLPLRMQVFGHDSDDPAVEVGFTSISFDEPDRSVFEFTPPPGATVEDVEVAEWLDETHAHKTGEVEGSLAHLGMDLDWEVVGSGWTSVAVVSGVDLDEMLAVLQRETRESGDGQALGEVGGLVDALLAQMQPVTGPDAQGMGLQTSLWSVLMLDDGRVLVGAVDLDELENVAGQ